MHMRRLWKVRVWLQADLQPPEIDFCLYPSNGHSEVHAGLPFVTYSRRNVDSATIYAGPLQGSGVPPAKGCNADAKTA